MNKSVIMITLLVPIFALTLEKDAELKSLSSFEWMLGEWSADEEENITKEIWQKVSSNTFEGLGEIQNKVKGEVKTIETLRLVLMSGEIFYIAKVAHNEIPIAFKLISGDKNSAVFANELHDFPTRIEYRLINSESLSVTVGSEEKSFTINFIKLGQL